VQKPNKVMSKSLTVLSRAQPEKSEEKSIW